MKILVTVTEVATVEDDFEIAENAIVEKYLDYDLNEWDEYAVEEAVQFAEANDDVEVVTVTIGQERSEETIRMALAKGADRAIRVWDDALEGAFLDVASKARMLRAVVEAEDPDFVLTGVQAADDGFGATGVTLAESLDMQWAAVVNGLDIDGDVAHVRRELEGGVEELTDVEMPAVFTIQTGINEPRYASLRGIRQAQRKEIAVQTLDDIGLDAAAIESDLELRDLYEPVSEGDATIFEGDAASTAAELAAVLRDKGVAAE